MIISDAEEIEKYRDNLRGFGGSGKLTNDKYIYRQVLGKAIPLGIGFTLNPAADVQGVATPDLPPVEIRLKDNKSSEIKEAPVPLS